MSEAEVELDNTRADAEPQEHSVTFRRIAPGWWAAECLCGLSIESNRAIPTLNQGIAHLSDTDHREDTEQ